MLVGCLVSSHHLRSPKQTKTLFARLSNGAEGTSTEAGKKKTSPIRTYIHKATSNDIGTDRKDTMSLVALNTTWITHPFSQLSFLSQSILFLFSALVLLLLTSAALKPLSRALTPKPFGFIPHLNGQRMILGDAARLMKFIGEKDCHTGE